MADCRCKEIVASAEQDEKRIQSIAAAAPNCGCENCVTSDFSPGVVTDDETVIRMICTPMHVHKKKREVLPSLFGHVCTVGLSVQRLEKATEPELVQWVSDFIGPEEKRVWLGWAAASTADLRAARVNSDKPRNFCVYDTAEKVNPAHAEVGVAYEIAEADQPEYRAMMMKIFNGGTPNLRENLMGGKVWDSLPAQLRERKLPDQWQ